MAKRKQMVVAYRITSKRDGFRRGGIIHTGKREYGVDELTRAQLAAIEAEPLLVLEKIELEKPDEEEEKSPPSAQGQGSDI